MPKKASKGAEYLYSTIRRGRIKVTSPQQHKLLETRHLAHTHVYEKQGVIIKRRVWPLPGRYGHPFKNQRKRR